jgi:hypothetical protein
MSSAPFRFTGILGFVHCPEFQKIRRSILSETGSDSVLRLWVEDNSFVSLG